MTDTAIKPQDQNIRFTLRKSAKLRHRTLVNDLFRQGKSVYSGLLRITFRPVSPESLKASFRGEVPDMLGPLQMMITVPKKKRRHAVDRVLMRRRIREAFRLQCHALRDMVAADPEIRSLSLAIVYMHTENAAMPAVYSAMGSALSKIIKKLSPQPQPDINC